MTERIKRIKENFKITRYEQDGISYEAVSGISPDDIDYVINELYEIKTRNERNVRSNEFKQLYE